VNIKKLMDAPIFEEITVQKYKLAVNHYMSKEMGDMMRSSMSLDKYYDEVYGRMTFQLSAYIAGNEVHKKTFHSHEDKELPATWWDALKLEHPWTQKILGEPKFKIFNYRTKTEHVHTHMCPHVNVPFNTDMGVHLKFLSESDYDITGYANPSAITEELNE